MMQKVKQRAGQGLTQRKEYKNNREYGIMKEGRVCI